MANVKVFANLLECPFCGSPHNSIEAKAGPCNQTLFYIKCLGCTACGPDCISESSAAFSWECRGSIPRGCGLWLDEIKTFKPQHGSFDVTAIKEMLKTKMCSATPTGFLKDDETV